jgi:hypothetical protein
VDPAGILGGEEDGDRTDVGGVTDAAQRRLRLDRFVEVHANETGGVNAFGFDHARIQGVHADLAQSKLLRERLDDIDGPLRGAVNGGAGRRITRPRS